MPKQEFKSWGQSWNPGIKQSKGLNCPSCGWQFGFNSDFSKYDKIIGFSDEIPFETAGLGIKILIGILMIECKECFEKFCFHVDARYAKMCKELCDKWPKESVDD